MAIGRISGPMLKNDLTRQGVDLSFEGNLLYLDVTNLRIGINKSSPSNALSVLGNIDANNLSVVSNVYSNGLYDGTLRALTQVTNGGGVTATVSGNTITLGSSGLINAVTNGGGITGTVSSGNLQLGSNANSANTASTIVQRDAAGDFAANVITTNNGFFDGTLRTLTQVTNGGGITGTVSGNTLTLGASGFANSVVNASGINGTINAAGVLTLSVNAGAIANSVSNGGGITGYITGDGALTLGSNANSSNSASTIVQRDGAGNFTANVITASNGFLDGTLRAVTQVTNGGGVTGTVSGNTLTLGASGFANSVINASGINGTINAAGVLALSVSAGAFANSVVNASGINAYITGGGALTLSVQAGSIVNSVSNGGGITGYIAGDGSLTLGSNGSSSNGASTIVTRGADGSFTANIITAEAFTSTRAGTTGDGTGQIFLNGATGNRIDWNTNGVAAPAFTTRSAGTKLTLYPAISGSQADYAIGIEAATLWHSVPSYDPSFYFKWYGGTTQIASLNGTGNLTTNIITANSGLYDGTLRALTQVSNSGGVTGTISGNTLTVGINGPYANSVVNASGINAYITSAGALTLSVTAGSIANSVSNGGGITGTISGSGALTLGSTANSSNSASTIVQRGADGSFTANIITANNGFLDGANRTLALVTNGGGVTGAVVGNTLTLGAVGFANSVVNAGGINGVISGAGVLTLSITPAAIVNSIVNGGGITGTISATGALTLNSNGSSSNGASTIVTRDAAGNFTSNVITASNGFFDGTLRTLTQVTNGGGVTGTVSGNTLTLGAVGFANSVSNANGIQGSISGAGVLTLVVAPGSIANSVSNGGGITGYITNSGVLTLNSNASSSNSASTIVQRDSAGNFTANVITASNGFLDGTLRTLTQVTNGGGVTGTISGNTLTLGASGFANSVVNASGINGTISAGGVFTISVSAGAFANSVTNGGGITGTISGAGDLALSSNANASNSASTIVQRDAAGNFAANVITANNGFLDGVLRALTQVTTSSGINASISGNTISIGVNAGAIANSVTNGGGITGYITSAGALTLGSNGSSSNGASTIVTRGADGSFSANIITATLYGTANTATSATTAGTVTTNAQSNITSVGILTGLTSSGIANITNSTAAINTTTGALTVAGGAGIGGNLYVGGPNSTIYGNLTVGNLRVTGNTTTIGSVDLAVADSIINLHTPADLSPLTVDDLRDIGIAFHYFKTQEDHAFLGWANDSGYLEWYDSGTEVGNVFTGNSYGTIKTGGMILVNNTPATNTTTGTLTVVGGISSQGNIYGAALYDGSNRVLTTANHIFANINANSTFINSTTSTDTLTFVPGSTNVTITANAITKTITIDAVAGAGASTDNLQNVTTRGATTANTIIITNAVAATNTTTGALQVTGGISTQNVVYAAGGLFDGSSRALAAVTNGGGVTGTITGNALTLGAIGFANSVVNASGINGTISGAGVLTLSVNAGAFANSVSNGGGITGYITGAGALTLGSNGSSSNGASTIVTRGTDGSFTANVITANNGFLDGVNRTLALVTNGGGVTGTVSGNTLTLGALGFANSVSNGGGINGTISAGGVLTLNSNANSSNSASTIVQRDTAGNFTANVITASNGHFDGTLRTLAQVTNGGGVTGTVSGNTLTLGAVGFANSVVNAGGINGVISGAGVLTLSITPAAIVNSVVNGGGVTGTISATGALTLGSNGSSANGASTIVTRDAAGNFTANVITASNGHFDGTLRTLAQVTNGGGVTGTISGNTLTLGATGFANSVTNGGGITGTISTGGVLTLNSNANASNSASTIVTRGADGSFAANIITATLYGAANTATSATTADTVTANAQPNITSVGTLTSLTSSGLVSITNATAATNTTTGALQVTGGISTQNTMYAAGGHFDGANRTLALVTNGGGVTGTISGNTLTLGAIGFANSVVNASGINGTISGAGVLTLSVSAGAFANSVTNGGGITGTISGSGALILGSNANSSNSASTIVQRDAAGNFAANAITANNGFFDGVLRAVTQVTPTGGVSASISGNTLSISVNAGSSVNSVSNGGGVTGFITGAGVLQLGSNATSSNVSNAIVSRDTAGNFTANVITANNGFFDGTLRTLTQVTNGGGVTGTTSGNTITLGAVGFANSVVNAGGINGVISGAGVLTLSVSAGAFANTVTNGGGITGTISGSGALILGSDANSSNSASTIVQRGADGSFTANIITANNGFLDGTNRTLALVTNGGGITGTVSGNTITLGSNATSSNVSNAIVSRDTSGSFTANVVTASRMNVTSTTGTSGVTSGALVVAGGVGIAGEIWLGTPTGDEGGQLNLALAATNTTLTGSVVIDVYQNRLRIFEGGGTARGVFIDLTAAGAGVSSNLLAGGGGGGGGVTSVSNGGGITGTITGSTLNLGSTANTSNSASTIVSRDAAGSFAGNVITGDTFVSLNNGGGTNFKVGDDAWIGDVNTADTMSIRGAQNAANGYIVFGNADTTSTLGRSGSGPLTYIGNANVTANLTAGNANVRGIVTVTGNITAGNIIAGGARSTTSSSAPSNPTVGDMWYDSDVDILFRYTYDGVSSFWLDISSAAGGITSTTSATAPVGPGVGDMWYDTDTDVLYRYTYDGTSSFWLDIAGPGGGSVAATLGNATINSGNITIVTPNVATQVQTLSASTYKTLRYTIQAYQGTDNLQIDDVVLGVINNTVALGQVTFINPTTGDMVTYTANIQSSNVYLYANVTSANTIITYVRTSING